MLKRISLVCSLALLPITAQAESQITGFLTHLGPPDAYNSRGAPLDDLCAIVSQDRANWHRFGNREQYDSGDGFFTTADRRAMIADKCIYDRNYYANAGANIRNGSRYYLVYVRVMGTGGQVTRITIEEGAG